MTLPTVTQIIRATLGPGFQAGEWYLQRGLAVHAACAMVAKGVNFDYDPRIYGQIEACRGFLAIYKPEIIEVETRRESKLYGFTGKPDLYGKINRYRFQDYQKLGEQKISVVIDYKASFSPVDIYQLGGYAELVGCRYGLGVELHEDGTFKCTELLDLRRARREFLALNSTYRILEKLGRLPKERENE
jgi:hypothetical protein